MPVEERPGGSRPNPVARAAFEVSPKRPLGANVAIGQLTIPLRHLVLVARKQHLYAVDSGPFLHLLDIMLGFRDASVPFSYLDRDQKPVGYAVDICRHIVDAVKVRLGLAQLEVRLNGVTSATRIPLIATHLGPGRAGHP
jgi:ABC-type amino acid transport substrate-binding protein